MTLEGSASRVEGWAPAAANGAPDKGFLGQEIRHHLLESVPIAPRIRQLLYIYALGLGSSALGFRPRAQGVRGGDQPLDPHKKKLKG